VITVTSGKGGVGKTSVSVNLAIQLSRLGRRVIVLDADFGLANIEIMLGIRPGYNLSDLMFRGKAMKDIITYGPEGIGFISGGSGINEMANLTREQIFHLIRKMEELDRVADVIIVDTGAGIGDSVLEFVAASEEVLLVATPEPTSITDGYALLKTLNRNSSYRPGKTTVKMIANQVRNGEDAEELFDKVGLIVNKFLNIEVEYLGGIPYDTNMQKAIMRQQPLSMAAPGAPAARSLAHIAARLENREEKEIRYGIVQLFSNVIKMKFQRR
jgi:flagellar biosynthesis protein FlhG